MFINEASYSNKTQFNHLSYLFIFKKSYNYVIAKQKIVVMEVSVIKIGNSKGIRLSKTLLERYKIKDSVELIMEKGQIILKPITKPRKGWDKAFAAMAKNGDDDLLIDDVFDDEDLEEWK